jgi:DNA-binding beta-propeller fold protein YncE
MNDEKNVAEPETLLSDTTRRHSCSYCGAMVVVGAQKCRGCKRWLRPQGRHASRFSRSLALVIAAVVAVLAVLISSRPSPVGEAPPLMRVSPTASGSTTTKAPPLSPHAAVAATTAAPAISQPWRSGSIQLDVHPLDLVFSSDNKTLYVSADDASVRAYDVASKKILHMMKVPAQGDRLRLLNDRYLAVIRKTDAAQIPIIDVTAWERDPVLVPVGANPADVVALPDGKTAVSASSRGRRLTWFDLKNGHRRDNIRLPHETRQLLVVQADGHPAIGAIGQLSYGGQPAGAWIDLFDPAESPFGATRRSIAVGRDPRQSAISHDGRRLILVDHVANTASLLRVDRQTEQRVITVDRGPIAAFFMHNDTIGVVINAQSHTATVIDVDRFEKSNTIMLAGTPSHAAVTKQGDLLVVALGGEHWPPKESGAVILSGSPLRVSATIDTGRGASRVATAIDGSRAAVACYYDRLITVIEH